MKNLTAWLSKAVRKPYFPLILILSVNLIAGLFTFQDYGLSWDEPLFYQYAEAVPYAYSIPARLSGNFDIEKAYGPSAEDHKIYGPIYLLLAKPVVDGLDRLLRVPREDVWHLVNFVTFQMGVALFYALCLRWMSAWPAFAATALFSTQPVLWGHAWINPKDVPFLVFFLAALYFGFKMVDAISEPPGEAAGMDPPGNAAVPSWWQRMRKFVFILTLVLAGASISLYIFSPGLESLLRNLIQGAYQASPGSLLGRVFGFLAANAQTVTADAYVNKGLVLFSRLRQLLAVLGILFLVPAVLLLFWNDSLRAATVQLGKTLAPLPGKPAWWGARLRSAKVVLITLWAGILLGLVISIRVIGPLAGVLVLLYFLFKPGRHSLAGMVVYASAALVALYGSWPYLWANPVSRFIEVLQHMSHNPKVLPVLFNGSIYPSDKLPLTYLPVMLAITLTWPVWLLFASGLVVLWGRLKSKATDWRSFTPILLWFFVPFVYALIVRPPIYDGYRHFLFLLPPAFILAGLSIQAVWERLRRGWGFSLVLLVLVAPGLVGLVKLHPYEYTYYNLLVGGTGGAYRHYETDFWLTCYKELMAGADEQLPAGSTLFVHRQPSIAQAYASPELTILRYDPDDDQTFPGSYLLLTTRSNVDLSLHPEAPELFSVGLGGAKFCLVKSIP